MILVHICRIEKMSRDCTYYNNILFFERERDSISRKTKSLKTLKSKQG